MNCLHICNRLSNESVKKMSRYWIGQKVNDLFGQPNIYRAMKQIGQI